MRSSRGRPEAWYFLAMDTTRRRFDCTKVCWAPSPCRVVRRSSRFLAGVRPFGAAASCASASRPASMAWAKRTSSSLVSNGYWPMSVRYNRTRSSSSRSRRSFANFTRSFVFPTRWGTADRRAVPPTKSVLADSGPAFSGATIAAFEVYRTRQALRATGTAARPIHGVSPPGPGQEGGPGRSGRRPPPPQFPAAGGTRGRRPRRGAGSPAAAPGARRRASRSISSLSTSRRARHDRPVGHRTGGPEMPLVAGHQAGQHHPVEAGQPGQGTRSAARLLVGRGPRRAGDGGGGRVAVQDGEQRRARWPTAPSGRSGSAPA